MAQVMRYSKVMAVVMAALMVSTASSAKEPQTNNASPTAGVEAAVIDGFRSARFGMTAKDVRDAIKKDFGIGEKDVVASSSQEEHTQSLTVKVKDLLPEAPPAAVSYILGATSKKLIQINVGWGAIESGPVSLENLLPTANTLRDFFLRKGTYASAVVANQKLPDGSILLFRGADEKGRMVLLQLKPIMAGNNASGKKDEKEQPPLNGTLLLAYIENSKNPDVFRIEKDKF